MQTHDPRKVKFSVFLDGIACLHGYEIGQFGYPVNDNTYGIMPLKSDRKHLIDILYGRRLHAEELQSSAWSPFCTIGSKRMDQISLLQYHLTTVYLLMLQYYR